jgi:hypothetical protein
MATLIRCSNVVIRLEGLKYAIAQWNNWFKGVMKREEENICIWDWREVMYARRVAKRTRAEFVRSKMQASLAELELRTVEGKKGRQVR